MCGNAKDIVLRLGDVLLDQGMAAEARDLEEEWQNKHATRMEMPMLAEPVRAVKLGRNEACPCGSGKK